MHIEDLNYEKGKKELDKVDKEKSLINDREYKETLRPLFNEYNEKLNKFDEDEIKTNYETFNKLKNELKDIENSMRLNESKTKALAKHRDDLDKYKYDEDCEFCIKNGEEQINEMGDIKTQLYHLDDEYQSLEKQFYEKSDLLEKVSDAETKKDKYDR